MAGGIVEGAEDGAAMLRMDDGEESERQRLERLGGGNGKDDSVG